MALCTVCKANRDIGGATYTIDGNNLHLCKDCYGLVETRILVVCPTCGFYWVSSDELAGKEEGVPLVRVTDICIKCEFKKALKALPEP